MACYWFCSKHESMLWSEHDIQHQLGLWRHTVDTGRSKEVTVVLSRLWITITITIMLYTSYRWPTRYCLSLHLFLHLLPPVPPVGVLPSRWSILLLSSSSSHWMNKLLLVHNEKLFFPALLEKSCYCRFLQRVQMFFHWFDSRSLSRSFKALTLVLASIWEPRSSNRQTMLVLPRLEATWRGVIPFCEEEEVIITH